MAPWRSATNPMRPLLDGEDVLTVKEATAIVGMSEFALYRRVSEQWTKLRPPFVRRGRTILFPKAAFMEWAQQKEIQ